MSQPVHGSGLTVAAHHFIRIRDLLTDYCGVCLTDDNRSRLGRILQGRLKEVGLSDVGEYVHTLEDSGPEGELARLVDEITNNETYFFREEFQLETFADEIVPEVMQRSSRRRRLNVWSAGCSSGEEPLTIAMVLRDSALWQETLAHWEVRILGTDVSRQMIRRAREGVYSVSSFKGLDDTRRRDIQRRYFRAVEDRFAPVEDLQRMVSYLHLNLLDRDGTSLFGDMDVIFCRNVLMYFPAELRLNAIRGFFRKLTPGGYLLLGHSENLLGSDTPFEALRLRGSLVYRKPSRRVRRKTQGWV